MPRSFRSWWLGPPRAAKARRPWLAKRQRPTIVGGKQNRIVNVTIWLTPRQKTNLPVTCLEAGRWDPGARARFTSGPKADLGMRRMMSSQVHASARMAAPSGSEAVAHRSAADQGAVWAEVDMRHQRAATSSRTGALHDLYAREASDVRVGPEDHLASKPTRQRLLPKWRYSRSRRSRQR